MLPDPGCYEERYRLAAGAAAGLASSLITIGLVFLTVAPWVTGVVIAVALLALMGPAVAARRMIGEFQASVKREPPVPQGAPLDFVPSKAQQDTQQPGFG